MRKRSKVRNVIWLVVDCVIVVVVAYFVFGYYNFFKISHKQEPVFVGVKNSYNTSNGTVTVNDYMVYKVVTYQTGKNISYSMKLWFMDDVR